MPSNCAPITLLEYLKEHVTALSDESAANIKLYVLSDEYANEDNQNKVESFMDYTPKRFKDEFLARKNLILIYQDTQIVLGMSTFEYAYLSNHSNWSRAYIQYVDTTGLFTPRQNQSFLTRSLVKSYLTYCKDILNMGSVHLLATAKPAFLFAGSEFIEGKRALPAVKLINWWIALIQDFTMKSAEKCKVFVYSPAEEAEGSTRMKKRISGFDGWTYGLPYASILPCVDQIPLFEDDPKWRHFEATILDDDELLEQVEMKTNKRPRIIDDEDEEPVLSKSIGCRVSVKEFFESIQIRPEFRSDPSTFFVIQFPKRIKDTATNPNEEDKLKKSDLASFGIKMLSGLTFESESSAKKSSQKISGWLKLMAVQSAEIKRIEKVEEIQKENISDVKVNSLQSFIKKKVAK